MNVAHNFSQCADQKIKLMDEITRLSQHNSDLNGDLKCLRQLAEDQGKIITDLRKEIIEAKKAGA